MRRIMITISILLLTFSLFGCSTANDTPPPPDDTPIDAKALIDGNCAQCHGLETVYSDRDAERWPAIVEEMARRASRNFSEDEVTAMTEYLQENHSN